MTALGNLVRLNRWVLDEKRRKLSDLQRLLDKLRGNLAALEDHVAAERAIASTSSEGATAYPSFVAAALDRRNKIQQSISNLEREVELAREEVGEAFRELKKYETAQQNAHLREHKKRMRREQLDLDELGIGIYRRRRAGPDMGA